MSRRPGPGGANPRRLVGLLASVTTMVLLAAWLSGCAGGSSPAGGAPVTAVRTGSADGLAGSRLDTPIPKPQVTLTDTGGQPYDFATATRGRLTLLYFGYTHCPDVCPTTMADINVALRQVPQQVRTHTTVVFVTSDPTRDTGAVLRSWLDTFDPSFVGLTGSVTAIDQMASQVGVDIEPPVTEPDGTISVTHGAQVVVFSPVDDVAHVVYTAGTDATAYAHDLPLLAAGRP